MEAIIVRGNKTDEELKEYVEHIKRVYGFTDDEICIVNTNKDGYAKIIKDIREF